MDKNLKLTITQDIAAPAAEVWTALTDPETITKFMWGTQAKSDWKVGSPLTFEGVYQGKQYHEKGIILDAEKGKLMRYTYLSSGLADKPENYAIITYRLSESDGKTTLAVSQEGAQDQPALEHSKEGWRSMMATLKQIVEKKIPVH